MEDRLPEKVEEFYPDGEDPQTDALVAWANLTFPIALDADAVKGKTAEEAAAVLVERVKKSYELKNTHEVPEALVGLERYMTLTAIDKLWQEHLYAMDGLREGVYLRAYGQKDPLIEYKQEAFKMFEVLMAGIKDEVLHNLFRSTSNIMAFEQFLSNLPQYLSAPDESAISVGMAGAEPAALPEPSEAPAEPAEPIRREAPKIGRNEPCPCGSGKKYKDCCGKGQ
jgi:preprotein translocase subunit SecA